MKISLLATIAMVKLFQPPKWNISFRKGDRIRRLTDGKVFEVDVMTRYGPQLVGQHGTFTASEFALSE